MIAELNLNFLRGVFSSHVHVLKYAPIQSGADPQPEIKGMVIQMLSYIRNIYYVSNNLAGTRAGAATSEGRNGSFECRKRPTRYKDRRSPEALCTFSPLIFRIIFFPCSIF